MSFVRSEVVLFLEVRNVLAKTKGKSIIWDLEKYALYREIYFIINLPRGSTIKGVTYPGHFLLCVCMLRENEPVC